MAGAQENGGKERTSMQMNGFSRDLLTKFMNGNHFPVKFCHAAAENVKEEEEEEENEEVEIELSLGLSLNGRFGVDPKRARQKIVRSSSIANFMMLRGSGGVADDDETKENKARVVTVVAHAPLMRTCSLPVEVEEEWRKRKEMQTLRRIEAKRKRMERKNVVRAVREKVDDNGGNGSNVIKGHGQGQYVNGLASSQGSLGSQGTGSSGISDFESQPSQGTSKSVEERSPSSVIQSQQEQNEQRTVVTPGTAKLVGADEKEVRNAKELLRHAMLDMPCVSTTGDGPNGKKIEGFLYRYQKGEEVKIVCVCHGSFFTPAEFIKHAGGGDVAHPLRHIVVDPSPLL